MFRVARNEFLPVGQTDRSDQHIQVSDGTTNVQQACLDSAEMFRRDLIKFKNAQIRNGSMETLFFAYAISRTFKPNE